MGISRDSMHKRRATGGKKKAWRKKRNMHASSKWRVSARHRGFTVVDQAK